MHQGVWGWDIQSVQCETELNKRKWPNRFSSKRNTQTHRPREQREERSHVVSWGKRRCWVAFPSLRRKRLFPCCMNWPTTKMHQVPGFLHPPTPLSLSLCHTHAHTKHGVIVQWQEEERQERVQDMWMWTMIIFGLIRKSWLSHLFSEIRNETFHFVILKSMENSLFFHTAHYEPIFLHFSGFQYQETRISCELTNTTRMNTYTRVHTHSSCHGPSSKMAQLKKASSSSCGKICCASLFFPGEVQVCVLVIFAAPWWQFSKAKEVALLPFKFITWAT